MCTTKAAGRTGAFTLVELMLSMGIAGLVASVVLPLMLYSSRSFAVMANYTELNGDSVNALDQLTRDIRQVVSLTSFATNQISMDDGTNGTLTFKFSTTNTLVRIQGSQSRVLLRGVDYGKFSIYQRTTISNSWDQYTATDAADCKAIEVQWKCSRQVAGVSLTTENDQSARIVIRKN